MKTHLLPVMYTLIILILFSCSSSHEGKYTYSDSKYNIFIKLTDNFFTIAQVGENGKLRKGFHFEAEYHINDSNIIILDKMISGRDSTKFQSLWNSFQVQINEDGIEFFEDFDRNDDRMFFTKVK
ncbi:MAG: hypothetical protein WEA99_04300 [Brumimicrobium sp.]